MLSHPPSLLRTRQQRDKRQLQNALGIVCVYGVASIVALAVSLAYVFHP